MSKKELVAKIAEQTGVSAKDVTKVIASFSNVVGDELAAGGNVQLLGFGTFSVGERAARTGRNPFTGEEIQIKASKSPKFKASKALKDKLN